MKDLINYYMWKTFFMKILLIEDDERTGANLKRCLEEDCCIVDWAKDGSKGSFWARTNKYDIILLDFLLPKKNGEDVCKEVRADRNNTPIIMLTVRFEISEKVNLLDIGVDDYLTKPYSYHELRARIRAILRRKPTVKETILVINELRINILSNDVTYCGENIYLTKKEFLLLKYLAERKNQVITRANLTEGAWDINAECFSNAIEMHISNIRKKLRKYTKTCVIKSVPGRGYKVVEY